MYQSFNANFDDMGRTWNAGHVICMISSASRGKPQTYEKHAKLSLKVKLCKTRPIKCISKTCAYLIMKKIWIEKIAKLLSHSIYNLKVICLGLLSRDITSSNLTKTYSI